MTAWIDLDSVVYRCLFATQDQGYYAGLRSCDFTLDGILSYLDSDYALILGGKGNFRYKLYDQYKAQRKTRPTYLHDTKKYFQKYWDAVETEGIETDDFIAMHYNPTMDIVVSNDKDFMQLGGRIYNWTKNEVIDVQDPMLHFWVQMLTGDRADNIPGVQNPEKAHHKNKPCFTTPTATEYLTSTPDRRSAVEAIYNKQFGRAWQVQFKLHGDLLWLQREVNDDFMNHI